MFLSRRKNGYYFIQYLDPFTNQVKRKSTGTQSKNEALRCLRKFNPEVPNRIKPFRISRFRDEYLEYVANNRSPKYIKSIELSFRQLLLYSRNIYLQDLDARLLDYFVSEKFSSSPAAASLYFRTLKAAFSKAVVWGYIDENPLKKIRPPKLVKSIPSFISKDEFDIILRNTNSVLLKQIFNIAFYTGMRLGEIVNLRWDWIDFDRNLLIVKNSKDFNTKNKQERTIPLNCKAKEVFKKKQNLNFDGCENCYIFYRVKGFKLNEEYISKQFKFTIRRAGLSEDIHFHTLRHSFASNLVQKGVTIFVLKELLGHKSISTTLVYSHLNNKNLVDAVSLLD